MDTLQIDAGVKRLTINGDETKVIEFNPSDILFANKFYAVVKAFETKQKEYRAKNEELERDRSLDEYGMPVNTGKTLELALEFCDFVKGQIDALFGAGTSKKAFGDAQSIGQFEQFFTGIMPFIEQAREDKMAKYSTKRPAGRTVTE